MVKIVVNVRLPGDRLCGILLFTWLSLVVSMMVFFVLSFFPRDVLDGILDLIESVSCIKSLFCFKLIFRKYNSLSDLLAKPYFFFYLK